MIHLKPCPCCDWQPDSDECPYPRTRTNDWYVVVCPNPKCELEIGGEDKEDAATRWNKRVTQTDPILTEYLKTMNWIDDFLEYRFKGFSGKGVRNMIMEQIDKLTVRLGSQQEPSAEATPEMIISAYIQTVHSIEDFLEYRYRHHSGSSIRDVVMENLDNLTNQLRSLQNPKVEPEPIELCDSCTFCVNNADDCTNENIDVGTTIYNKMGYVIRCKEFKPVGDMCSHCDYHDGHCMVDTDVDTTFYDKHGNVVKCSLYKFPNDMGEL